MNQVDLKGFLKNIADYTGTEASEVTENTDLYEDLLIDSLGLFSLGIYLTGIYHLEVPLSDVAVISKVSELYDLLCQKGVPVNDQN